MPALVSALVDCGAMVKKKTGPAHPMSPEERIATRRLQNQAAGVRRRAAIEEAKAQGLPPPTFKRGRPRKYPTEEMAREAKRQQWKTSGMRHKERVTEATEILRRLSAEQLARWTV